MINNERVVRMCMYICVSPYQSTLPPTMGMVQHSSQSPPPNGYGFVCMVAGAPLSSLWLSYVVVMVCDCGCIALQLHCITLQRSAFIAVH